MKKRKDGYWKVKKNVIQDAKRFHRRSHWKKASAAAYQNAKKNGWFDEAVEHMEYFTKPQKYWNPETCREEAKKFLHKIDFRKKSAGAYDKARDLGILDEICAHMRRPQSDKLKYTYDFCKEEVAKYEFIEDLRKGSPGVYRAILYRDWKDELLHNLDRKETGKILHENLIPQSKKQNSKLKYTYEFCQKEVAKYEFIEDLRKGSPGVYKAISYRDWSEQLLINLKRRNPPPGFYNIKENCQKEAFRFKHKSDFQKNASGAYVASKKNGWFEEVTSLLVPPPHSRLKWTKKAVLEEALKFETRKELGDNCPGAYDAALRKNWIDEVCQHMQPIGSKYYRCIYSLRHKNEIYIGLTFNFQKRISEHRQRGKQYKYLAKKGEVTVKRETPYLPVLEAQKKENSILKEYQEAGLKILNKAKTGGLGTALTKHTLEEALKLSENCTFVDEYINKYPSYYAWISNHEYKDIVFENLVYRQKKSGYWTKANCIKAAKSCSSKSEFEAKFSTACGKCRKNGWYNEATAHMVRPLSHRIKWTKETIAKEALLYETRKSFSKGAHGAYSAALQKGYLDEVCSHMRQVRKPPNYWTKERCLQEAQKYQTKAEFRKKASSVYSTAERHGWLELCCQDMISYEELRVKWTFEACAKESKKYKTKIDWKKMGENSYAAACRRGWLPELTKHMVAPKKKIKWTKEAVGREALKYTSRTKFAKGSIGAYEKARSNGWLNSVCKHM